MLVLIPEIVTVLVGYVITVSKKSRATATLSYNSNSAQYTKKNRNTNESFVKVFRIF